VTLARLALAVVANANKDSSMMAMFVLVFIYFLVISVFLPEIVKLPLKMLSPTFSADASMTSAPGKSFFEFLFLILLGCLLWFLLAYLPLHLSSELNAVASYRFWFAAPLLVGFLFRRLFAVWRMKKRKVAI
jgi:hypothetical protein